MPDEIYSPDESGVKRHKLVRRSESGVRSNSIFGVEANVLAAIKVGRSERCLKVFNVSWRFIGTRSEKREIGN